MVILVGGSTHTGKTNLAQKLMEKYKYPYVSIDHIKMGLIRSGMIECKDDDNEQTKVLWPVIREMIKTVIENEQNIIIEGCYIPQNWKESFDEDYLEDIKCLYLIMSTEYIEQHFDDIKKYASVIEDRGEDEDCTLEELLKYNKYCYEMCKKYDCDYKLISDSYDVDELIEDFSNL